MRRLKRGKEIDRELEKFAKYIEGCDERMRKLIEPASIRHWIGKLRLGVIVEDRQKRRWKIVEFYCGQNYVEAVVEREVDGHRLMTPAICDFAIPLSETESRALDSIVAEGVIEKDEARKGI